MAGCGGASDVRDALDAGATQVADAAPPRFVEAPTLSPNENVPLAPRLTFETDVPTRARVDLQDGAALYP